MHQTVLGIALAVIIAVAVLWMVSGVLVEVEQATFDSMGNISEARSASVNRSSIVIQR